MYYKGKIDDIQIYDRALTQNEIRSLFSGENISKNLIAYWPMNEGIGETVYDQSPYPHVGRINSTIRVRENTELMIPIQRIDRELSPSTSKAELKAYIDKEKVLSKTIDPTEIEPGENYRVEITWTHMGDHEVRAVLEHGEAEVTSARTFEVGPPLNPPLKSLDASVTDTRDGLEVVLDPVSAWDYEVSEWDTSSEVIIHWNRLLRDEKTFESTYHISDSHSSFTIPYEDFYRNDGNYTVAEKW